MLSETSRRNKENLIRLESTAKEGSSLVNSTIANLRE